MEHLMKKFDVFVFDWDGTLATLGPLYALNERFSPFWKHKKKRYSAVEKDAAEIKRINYNIKKRMRETRVEGKLFARFVDMYFALSRPRLQRGSREVLDELKRNEKVICLFTNGATWRIQRELSGLGLMRYFEVIVSAQEIRAIKPNPSGLNAIIKEIGAEKGDVLYTGDMVDDVMMAKYAKVSSCAIADGFSSYQNLRSARPTYLFRTMEEFKKSL